MSTIIVSGIHTNVGKTIVSAILTEALEGEYWKPIQTGLESDRELVESLLSKPSCYPESYWFKAPLSPHIAAKLENKRIEREKIRLPQTKRYLIVEGSGGLLSPLDDEMTQAEFFFNWKALRILVIKHYLGSINHSLLSTSYGKPDLLIFNGEQDIESERFILKKTSLPYLRVPHINITKREIQCLALEMKPILKKILKPSGILSPKD